MPALFITHTNKQRGFAPSKTGEKINMAMKNAPTIGDRVAYSANWLRSTGNYAGRLPFLRGEIINLEDLCKDFTLAHVQWEGVDEPAKINIRNLAKVGTAAMNAN